MKLKEGSIVPINLYCGHGEKRITLIQGKSNFRCSTCGTVTTVVVRTDSNGDIVKFVVR